MRITYFIVDDAWQTQTITEAVLCGCPTMVFFEHLIYAHLQLNKSKHDPLLQLKKSWTPVAKIEFCFFWFLIQIWQGA